MTIRLLDASDATQYRDLRLEALLNDPDSYVSTYQHEKEKSARSFSYELNSAQYQKPFGYYGIFHENTQTTQPPIATTTPAVSQTQPDRLQTSSTITPTKQETLCGYIHLAQSWLSKQAHIAYLYNLYISKNFRKQKMGTQLVHHVFQILKDYSSEKSTLFERVFLTCNAKNTAGYHFYSSLGFTECGRKPNSIKWQNEYDDEIEMVYELQ